jgi:bifunctional non-homologous end joining protein LigD
VNARTTWVRPELVAEVRFAEWTEDGVLRAPVFLRLREDKDASEAVSERSVVVPTDGEEPGTAPEAQAVIGQLEQAGARLEIVVEGHRIALTNLDKELWPGAGSSPPVTKRDLLVYFARVAPFILPHLRDRPLTMSRYPNGIQGGHFYQKHWSGPVPEFAGTVSLTSEHAAGSQEYLVCNNLPTLLWLGQNANLELHTWFSRTVPGIGAEDSANDGSADHNTGFPDFLVFDLDPYIYSGAESPGDEPELNREAFARTCEVAGWLKPVLDGLHLPAFVKTSGRTGLHIFVPIHRRLDYRAVRAAAGTVAGFLLREHPQSITTDWSVAKRAGKVFIDFNQNVRGKTVASVYSPRPSPEATVSMAVLWDELGHIYPTDFTIRTAPERLDARGDLWQDILAAKSDLDAVLRAAG